MHRNFAKKNFFFAKKVSRKKTFFSLTNLLANPDTANPENPDNPEVLIPIPIPKFFRDLTTQPCSQKSVSALKNASEKAICGKKNPAPPLDPHLVLSGGQGFFFHTWPKMAHFWKGCTTFWEVVWCATMAHIFDQKTGSAKGLFWLQSLVKFRTKSR